MVVEAHHGDERGDEREVERGDPKLRHAVQPTVRRPDASDADGGERGERKRRKEKKNKKKTELKTRLFSHGSAKPKRRPTTWKPPPRRMR